MKREIRILFTALMFFTRITCPKWTDHNPVYMKESGRYFSLIGWVIGAISAGVFWVSNLLFSVEISAVLSIAASIRLTGAFHEDGLADVGDGFGGGWTKEKIIMIMKDPSVGNFRSADCHVGYFTQNFRPIGYARLPNSFGNSFRARIKQIGSL